MSPFIWNTGRVLALWDQGTFPFLTLKVHYPMLIMQVLYEELCGSEGVSQVYGLVTDWMNTLEPSDLKRIEWILYDDMCHLGKNKYDSSSIY